MIRNWKAWSLGVLLVVGISLPVLAGPKQGSIELTRSIIETQRQAIVTENLNLTEAEAREFWPLFREFQGEMRKVNDLRVAVIENYAKSHENMTDTNANKLIEDYFTYQQNYLDVRKKFSKKFHKILPATKVARYFQIENKMDAVINYELAGMIPLMDASKSSVSKK